jgi:hypothetical protein
VSIVQSIDAEISGVSEEIAALEEQLDGKRGRLGKLNELRAQAEALNGEGGGLPDPAPTPAPPPKPAPSTSPTGAGQLSSEFSGAIDERVKAIAALLQEHPEGLAASEIRTKLQLSANQFRALRPALVDAVDREGTGRATVYFAKEVTDRPSQAPARDRRAAPAPAPKPKARHNLKAAEEHNALRDRVKAAVLQILEDGPSAGMGKDRLTEAVLEAVPGATAEDVTVVRVALTKKQGAIEIRANKICLTGVNRTKPITAVEKEVVACLGSGRTVKEVTANCEVIRNAFSARTILFALEARGIVSRRPDSDPAVYVAVDQQLQEVAA